MGPKNAYQVRSRDVLDLAACGEMIHFQTFFDEKRQEEEASADDATSPSKPRRPETGTSVISASSATVADVIRYADKFGYTAMHIAVVHGHFALVKLLLEQGADPNVATDAGVTPLHCAAEYGHMRIVELLLEHGAEVHHYTKERYELALGLAMMGRHSEVVVRLEPLVKAQSNSEDALIAAASGDMVYFLLKLLSPDRGAASFAAVTDAGDTALHVITKIGVLANVHYEAAELIASKKLVDVNARNTQGMTPLMYATRTANVRLIALLLKHGADPTISSDAADASRTAMSYTSNDRVRVLLDEAEKRWDFEVAYAKRNQIPFDERPQFITAVTQLRRKWDEAKVSHRVYCEDNRIDYVPV